MTPSSVADIAAVLETWAPPATAQSYDNVGLQVGRRDRPVKRLLVALDCTPAVVAEARAADVDLIVSHHPLLFRPVRTLTGGGLVESTALQLAESGIALYSAHTNLDSAPGGVSFALAAQLGVLEPDFLQPLQGETLRKLVVFVPGSHADVVRQAMGDAGAGRIGAYEHCSFSTAGTGSFRPLPNATPYTGTATGQTERVDEVRIEVETSAWNLGAVISALKDAHPYEEVVYDVYALQEATRDAGLGVVGELSTPERLDAFLNRVCNALGTPAVQYVGDVDIMVSRVAVCGGSGGDLIPIARAAEAHVLVTADISYHRYFDAMDEAGRLSMAVVDAGHYETEAITEQLLVDRLSKAFPGVDVVRTACRTGPVRTFVSRGN